MKKKSESTQQQPKSQNLSIGDRLLRVQSIIVTSRLACTQLGYDGDSQYHEIGETLETAESMLGEIAYEIENQPA